MKNKLLHGTAAVSVSLAIVAFISPIMIANMSAYAQENNAPVDTRSAVVDANWSDNVTITIDDEAKTFRFQSDGIPSHGFAEKYLIPNDPNDQPFSDKPASAFTIVDSTDFKAGEVDATITTQPNYVEMVTDTSLGRIGVALSGAQLYNDYENLERTIVAKDDQVIHDHVAFLDDCNGHTLADGTSYHYHGIPLCITAELDKADSHSFMLGVLEDGFPVYGNFGLAGEIVTNADLDECSGHIEPTPEFPEGIYHYHLTDDEAPYMIDCFHGEVDPASLPTGGPPDFSAIAETLGVSVDALTLALGSSRTPDYDAAAQTLGISVEKLRSAIPKRPPQ